ncbi:MAG: heavy metal translocating P-type ATPase, partial [Clostridiales bacterium]
MKKNFDILGMSCSACAAHIEKSLKKLKGIQKADINLLANSLSAEYDEDILVAGDIIAAVEKAGYHAQEAGGASVGDLQSAGRHNLVEDQLAAMKSRLWISILFLLPLMYIAMGGMLGLPVPSIFLGQENAVIFAFSQFLLTLPIVYVNRKYFITGFKLLAKGAPNMDTLIALGSAAALLYGIFAIYQMAFGQGHDQLNLVHLYMHDLYFESSGMILTLITVGKYLETASKGKTSQAIEKLIDLTPKTALRWADGLEEEIPVGEVVPGDILLIKPGAAL